MHKVLLFTFTLLLLASGLEAQSPGNSAQDSLIVLNLLKEAEAETDSGKLPLFFARKLIGTPYAGGTLDWGDQEQLVVDLREMDCTTFVENVLALSVTTMQGRSSFCDFMKALQMIRYRSGYREGYASRLHYFSEWIADNELKGVIKEISGCYSKDSLEVNVYYMSTHPENYPRLGKCPGLVRQIRNMEKTISGKKVAYLSKDKLTDGKILSSVKEGDIAAITTDSRGLDIVHVGFVVLMDDGLFHLLHASSRLKEVAVDPLPLAHYLRDKSSMTGLRILRINEDSGRSDESKPHGQMKGI